jgi:hypothetical protein
VVRALVAGLTRIGIREDPAAGPPFYPEARSDVEARALAVLARAASPLAVDLLLAQHGLWSRPGAVSDPARDRVLNRLIDPPLVVAVGASNIGKSTLVNALAGRSVSIVADEPGTTRDHVGVMLELGGLVVRYVDTPGIRERAGKLEEEALGIAFDVASRADLLLQCFDSTSAPMGIAFGGSSRPGDVMQVGLRADLGPPPVSVDATVSVARGEGLAELVGAIRERLVPDSLLREDRSWKFW